MTSHATLHIYIHPRFSFTILLYNDNNMFTLSALEPKYLCHSLCHFTHRHTLCPFLSFLHKYHSRTQGFVICCIIPHFVAIVLVVFVTFMCIYAALWVLYSPQSKNNVLQIPLYFLYTHAYIPFGFIGLSNILPLAVSPPLSFRYTIHGISEM